MTMVMQSFSSSDPYLEMQKAVDIVGSSDHPTNKIAATLCGLDKDGKEYSISRTNFWPQLIASHIGTDTDIGNSSGTIHAETACILNAPYTYGSSLFITDPFCPNCAKNIAEAGIANIYIDHKGLSKDWIARNEDAFRQMSLRICERAGINVYKIKRKERKISAILEQPADYKPLHENPVEIEEITGDFPALIAAKCKQHEGHEFACALAEDKDGKTLLMTARRHAAIGYSREKPESMEDKQGKYSFIVQPITRLLMNAPRNGLKLVDGSVFCTRVPTAREQVNMVGAGLSQMIIGDMDKARDDGGFAALEQLQNARIFTAGTL